MGSQTPLPASLPDHSSQQSVCALSPNGEGQLYQQQDETKEEEAKAQKNAPSLGCHCVDLLQGL